MNSKWMSLKFLPVALLFGLSACASPEDAEPWVDNEAAVDEPALDTAEQALLQGNRRTEIRNQFTGKCLDIPWGLPSAIPVNQYTCHHGPAQQFSLVPFVGHLFTLRNASSGKCVTLGSYNAATRSYPLVQTTCNPGVYYQIWELAQRVDTATGARGVLRSGNDGGVCIDVPGGSFQDSLQLQAFPCHFGANQTFTLTHW